MFDLEKSITAWRQQMLTAGIGSPVPLEELESHLREEIERQMKLGSNDQNAFAIAASQIGRSFTIKQEFGKLSPVLEVRQIIKLAGIICVVVALAGEVVICAPMILTFAVKSGPEMSLIARAVPPFCWGMAIVMIILSFKYNHKFLPPIYNPLPRRAIGLASFLGCMLWMRFALFYFPFGGENFSPFTLVGAFCILTAEWMMIAFLGGLAHGLEKAAAKNSKLKDISASYG